MSTLDLLGCITLLIIGISGGLVLLAIAANIWLEWWQRLKRGY